MVKFWIMNRFELFKSIVTERYLLGLMSDVMLFSYAALKLLSEQSLPNIFFMLAAMVLVIVTYFTEVGKTTIDDKVNRVVSGAVLLFSCGAILLMLVNGHLIK